MTNEILNHPADSVKIVEALACLGNGKKTVREMRKLIVGLETIMKAMPGYIPGTEFDTRHHFQPGIYMREAQIPKGMVLTGRIHKSAHLNILSQGKLTVWTEEGMKTLSASTVIQSKAGMKRVGYSHEDSVWITVHQNLDDERDIKKIEARLFADTFEEAYSSSGRTFEDAILFLGFTAAEVRDISENESDQVPFTGPEPLVEVRESSIQGLGIFAKQSFEVGDFIAPMRVDGQRTPAGRYCNHSGSPNSEPRMLENGDVGLFATQRIAPSDEVINDYYHSYINSRYGG